MNEIITFRGNKEVWQKFVKNIKSANKDVWEVLEPLLAPVIQLDYIKIKKCIEAALKEYYDARIIDKLIFTQEVPDTDGKFIQIYNGGIIDEAFFKEDRGTTYHSPLLPALGSRIAVGERDHLIKEILKSKEIKNVKKVERSKIDISFLSVEGSSFMGNTTIFVSSMFSKEIYNSLRSTTRVRYENSFIFLDNNIKILFIPQKTLENKILIIEDLSCQWQYTKSLNPITGRPEILQILIDPIPKEKKVQVLAKTLGKLNILSTEGIKIYEVNKDK